MVVEFYTKLNADLGIWNDPWDGERPSSSF